MKSTKKLTQEIHSLNSRLDEMGTRSRYMIYSSNPWKFAWFNFIAGIFHSLGSLFGTAVIAAALVYVFSQFNYTRFISNFIQNTLNQVQWEKIVPTPTGK